VDIKRSENGQLGGTDVSTDVCLAPGSAALPGLVEYFFGINSSVHLPSSVTVSR